MPNTYAVSQSIKNLRFSGARIIDPLRTATHQEVANAFGSSGLKPSSHFIMRVKDVRTENLGLKTFGDLEALFKNGQITPIESGKLLSLVHDNLEVIINADTGTLITLKPR